MSLMEFPSNIIKQTAEPLNMSHTRISSICFLTIFLFENKVYALVLIKYTYKHLKKQHNFCSILAVFGLSWNDTVTKHNKKSRFSSIGTHVKVSSLIIGPQLISDHLSLTILV